MSYVNGVYVYLGCGTSILVRYVCYRIAGVVPSVMLHAGNAVSMCCPCIAILNSLAAVKLNSCSSTPALYEVATDYVLGDSEVLGYSYVL